MDIRTCTGCSKLNDIGPVFDLATIRAAERFLLSLGPDGRGQVIVETLVSGREGKVTRAIDWSQDPHRGLTVRICNMDGSVDEDLTTQLIRQLWPEGG